MKGVFLLGQRGCETVSQSVLNAQNHLDNEGMGVGGLRLW